MSSISDPTLLSRLTEEGDSVVARVDGWASATPSKPFFYCGERRAWMSYGDFGALTDRIAGNLAAKGVQPGDHVAVLARDQWLTTLAMFAIWKAGAVYCPLNFNYTNSLLGFQIKDVAPALLIVEPTMEAQVNEAMQHTSESRSMQPSIAESRECFSLVVGLEEMFAPAVRPSVATGYAQVAAIVYTSGTTGMPKGARLTYRWINQMTFYLRKLITQDDIVYNDLPLYHVGGAFCNIARAAWVGAGVACWGRFSAADFWDRIDESGASCAILLDVMIPWLMSAPQSSRDRLNTLNKVNLQPLPLNHNEVARRFGFDLVATGFGQTESGNSLVAYILETDEETETPPDIRKGLDRTALRRVLEDNGATVVLPEEAARKGYMGRPTVFVEAGVVDEEGNLLQPGGVGELVLRPRLPGFFFSGYHHRDAATLEANRDYWFRTGDVARIERDGSYTFIDRMADRIRVRGENLSSFQVEDLFNKHPAVSMCAAFPVRAAVGEEDDIVLYAVPVTSGSDIAAELEVWSRDNVPKFMRPRYIRIIPELPRTQTNKVEKFKLRQMFATERAFSTSPEERQNI